MLTVRQWIEKATWTTPDIQTPTGGGWLNPEQTKQFLRVAIETSVLLRDARSEFIGAPKAEVPRISFGTRILRAGVEGVRLADADRVKPQTGLITLSTVLFKGEVPVSDELFEDNVEGEGVADTVMQMVAEGVGRDLEEIAIKSDTARVPADPGYAAVLDQTDGIVKQLQTGLPAGQKINGTGATSLRTVLGDMVQALPARYRSNPAGWRFYVPYSLLDAYIEELASRGTVLGDAATTNQISQLGFRGIPVIGVPLLSGADTINGGAFNYGQTAILINPANIIAGYHRRVRVERYRDPREGVTAFLPSVRFDVKLANPDEAVLATNVAF